MTAMDTEEIQVTELDVDTDSELTCQAMRNRRTGEHCGNPASWRVTVVCPCATRDYLLCGDHKIRVLRYYMVLTCKKCFRPISKITRVIPI